MALKVAIVGLWDQTRHQAPWDDPEWELWGLPWDREGWPKFTRTFEPHDDWQTASGLPDYAEKLANCAGLYMQDKYLPNATRYPFEDVAETTGDDAWESSISYALALAIHEGAAEIGIYGVAMEAGSEYAHQRANLLYLIGFARGKGIKVHVPKESPLFKHSGDSGYKGRYGRIG